VRWLDQAAKEDQMLDRSTVTGLTSPGAAGHAAAALGAALLLSGCLAHQSPRSAAPGVAPAGVQASPAEPQATSAAPQAPPAPPAPGGHEEAAPRFGTVHFPVSCSAPAQAQFDLAVSQLHSFFYPETVKAFEQVLLLDPSCAMACWGLARSQLPNPLVQPFPPGTWQRGREAIARGQALGPPTERERDWLAAAAALFDGPDDLPYRVRSERSLQAMAALAQRYPDDLEVQAFYALALLESADPHDKSFARELQAARLLERLAPDHPDHPGITHYVIHAYDHSPIAGQGLEAANAYARIAPSAPHALHMPSHIYSMLGQWKPSLASNERTLQVASAYAARSLPPGVVLVGEPHSLDFMVYADLQLGKDLEARQVVERAEAITKVNAPSIAADAALAAIPVRYALERGAWAEAAALGPRPSAYPYAEAVRHFGRAVGEARMGDPDRLGSARGDITTMRALQARYAAKPDQAYWSEQTEILIDAASGWLSQAEGDQEQALRLLRRAADLEDASEKHVAMENRLFPAREQLAELLLADDRPAEALAEFEASLRSTPNRLRGLYGAARAAELSGEPGLAAHYYGALRVLTEDASGPRAEIAEARTFLAARH
jgi:tetratricopeptide (TPR) repeat protein